MPTPRKIAQLADLKSSMERAQVIITADYRGLSVGGMLAFRRALRESGLDIKVVKNRIAAMAANAAEHPELTGIIDGPTAMAFGYDDPIAPAKAFKKYLDENPRGARAIGAWLDGQVLDAAGLQALAAIPGRDELIAQIAAKFQSPIQNFAGLIQATMRDFNGLVDARANQLEAESGEAA